MKIFQFFISLATVLLCQNANAQQIYYPLTKNQDIIGYRNLHQQMTERATRSADTLSLPFVDDFSEQGIYPSSDRWLDSGAFVNSTFCDAPPTVGVATFDGINKFGNRYSLSSSRQYLDSMTSKPIRLGFAAATQDTTIWLSFYYQPQGLGIAPGSLDSLILLMRDSSGTWSRMWNKTGSSRQPFQRVNVHITDAKYFYEGFQFRFVNYGLGNANTGHWNVDYIWLNKGLSNNEPIRDIALINNPTSLLWEFKSMPYTHYSSLSSPNGAMKTTVTDSVRSIDYLGTTFDPYVRVLDPSGTTVFTSSPNVLPITTNSAASFTSNINYFFQQSLPGDSQTFLVENYLSVPVNDTNELRKNDTSYYHQNFFNYYAYDDGSAELNTGLSGDSLKWAMKFDVKMRDTLRGVQIYFNPTSIDVSNQLIQVAVWDNISVPSTEHILYKVINMRPDNIDSINGFATYIFPSPQVVGPGNIWVGFIQNTNVLIGLGVDKNTDSHTKMYYAANGTWSQPPFASTWMIRPLFGKPISLVGVNEVAASVAQFDVYPNPANGKIHLSVASGQQHDAFQYHLTDISGRTVKEGLVNDEVDVSALSAGVYFVRVSWKNVDVSQTKKVVVYR